MSSDDAVALAEKLGSGAAAEAIVGGDWNAQPTEDDQWDLCDWAWDNDEKAVKRALGRGASDHQRERCFTAYFAGFKDEITKWQRSGKPDHRWEWSR